jgi:hypothetical protein
MAGQSFVFKTFGTHNVPGRMDRDPVFHVDDQKQVAGSPRAIIMNADGNWHLFAHHGRAKHTGTNLGAQTRLVRDNETRVKALFRSFSEQWKNRCRDHNIHTAAAVCEHGKHRSVAVQCLMASILRELGAVVDTEHLSKPNWSQTGCGVVDCEQCDVSKNLQQRKELTRTALPWLRDLL